MKTKLSLIILLTAALTLLIPSCTKETPAASDTISVQNAPSDESEGPAQEPGDAPSKYKEGDLVSLEFTAHNEGTKTSLGAPGTDIGGGRAVYWELGDKAMFVWGPDAEDRAEGTVTAISEDGREATFFVNNIYAGAPAVYAVYPSTAFCSFEKLSTWDADGAGTVRVSIGKMADGTPLNGTFAQAGVCIGRSSLENRQVFFKHVVAMLSLTAAQPSAAQVKVDAGASALSGILPLTVSVDGEGVTGDVTPGTAENTANTVTVGTTGTATPTYIPVLPGLSFAAGVNVSFLDSDGASVGAATLQHATTLGMGILLSFPSSIIEKFSCDYYVKPDGSGSKDGSSWDNAWSIDELETYLETSNAYDGASISQSASINIHLAAGTYAPAGEISARGRYTDEGLTTLRKISLIGGYPSDITDATAASKPRNPAVNETVFSGASMTSGSSIIYMRGGTFSYSGLTFTGRNSSSTGAPAVYAHITNGVPLNCEFHHCTFTGNTNTRVGGALMLNSNASTRSDLLLEDCIFSNNSAGAAAAVGSTGILSFPVFRRCTFSNNTVTHYAAHQDGGAVKVEGSSPVFESCTFSGNSLSAEALGGGAAVWIMDGYENTNGRTSTFKDCTFTGNYVQNALSKGGAVWVQRSEKTVFENCSFEGNYCACATSATSYGGAMVVGDKRDEGQNRYSGYASYVYDARVELKACTFDGNYIAANTTDAAEAKIAAGAIYLFQPDDGTVTLDIKGGEYKNHDDNSDLRGGAIYVESGTLSIDDGATFTGNQGLDGGAVFQQGGVMDIARASFSSNSSENRGGAICCEGGSAAFTGTTFSGNTAASQGGAVGMQTGHKGSLTFRQVTFSGNTATASGGGAVASAANNGNTLSFSECFFNGNTSKNHGGAICNYQNANLLVENCNFTDNVSTNMYGGAIYHAGEGKAKNLLTVTGGSFSGNRASRGGGAIEISQNSTGVCYASYNIRGVAFNGNYTTVTSGQFGRGGAIAALTSGTGLISGCTFEGNYTSNNGIAEASGGACFLYYGNSAEDDASARGSVSLTGCTFSGNHTAADGTGYSQDRGGAVAVGYKTAADYLDVRIDKCNFLGNYATQGGALLAHDNHQSTVFINDCLFDGNYARINYGTTINAFGPDQLCLNNCTFHNSWCTNTSKNIYALQWINISNANVVLSNSVIIGQPQRSDSDETDYNDSRCSLVRIEPSDKSFTFINNIIASPRSWCQAMVRYQGSGYAVKLYSNKLSPVPSDIAVSDSDDYNANDFLGTSAYFGDLSWTSPATGKTYANSYWSWNGSMATGSVVTMNTLADINSKINTASAGFYNWLNSGIIDGTSVDGLSKDQRGNLRTLMSWPGAYQGNTTGLPEGTIDIAAANSRAAGLSRYETANCYVINAAGKYAFPADIRGNGVVAGSGESPATNSGIASAAEVWDDNNVVKSVSLVTTGGQHYVVVETPATFAKGNALVAVKNSSNQIVWSWHIWATSYRLGQDDQVIGHKDYGCWGYMPLELGMTDTDQTACTHYQWGRKDPFRYQNPSRTTENHLYISTTIRNPDWYYTPSASVYAIKNPESAGVLEDESLWNPGNSQTTTVKTMLDPCPPGYYIMPYKASELILKDGAESVTTRTQVTLKSGISMRYHAIINGANLVTSWANYYFQISHWHADLTDGKKGSSSIRDNGTAYAADNCGCGFGFPVRAVRDGRYKAGFMGDSITQIWGGSHEDNTDPLKHGDRLFFVRNGFLNKGISGQTTNQMLARFDADIVANHPEKVVILAGTNDIAGNDNGGVSRSSDHILGNIATMAQKALAGGTGEVYICSVLPVTEYSWRKTIVPMPLIKELNAKLRAYCEATAGCSYVDYYSAWLNETGDGPKDGLTYDGVHPTPTGCALLESIILPRLQ
ncbi:MAG: hypothetical protein IJR34_03575 [Bacteroidales bacterium]|nr:hypothetical protein [Bacteroidales bacterium]